MIARTLLPLSAWVLTAACVAGPAFTVDSTADAVDAQPGDGVCGTSVGACTLRAAIQEANAGPGGANIYVPPGTYTLTLAEPGDGGIAGGDLDVTDTLRIRPAGSGRPEVVADGEFRVFDLSNAFIRLDSLEIRGGDTNEGAGIRVAAGALVYGFQLVIAENEAFTNGAGIITRGDLVLWDSELRDNFVAARGGALQVTAGGSVTVWNSTLSGNEANVGAGIHNQGAARVFNTTVSGNRAPAGGAGGLFNSGQMTLANATVAFNEAAVENRPAGIWNYDDGVLSMRNSIVAGNTNIDSRATDCLGTIDSQGYNLIQSPGGCVFTGSTTGDITGQNPQLGTLQVNGSGTPTHAFPAGAPPHDAGNPGSPGPSPPACWANDQRGEPRQDCDIGAYERSGG